MNKRDQEYIDSSIEVAIQMLRHFYDIEDDQAIKLARESLNRLEKKNELSLQAFNKLTGQNEWHNSLDSITIRKTNETTKNIQKSNPTDTQTETKERRIHLESNRVSE